MKQWEKKTPVLWENALGYCLLKYKWVLDLSRLIIKGRFLTLSAQILQCRAAYIATGGYICRCQLFLGAQPPRYEFSRSLKPRLQATNSAERSLHASPQPQGCSGVGRHLLGPLHSQKNCMCKRQPSSCNTTISTLGLGSCTRRHSSACSSLWSHTVHSGQLGAHHTAWPCCSSQPIELQHLLPSACLVCLDQK